MISRRSFFQSLTAGTVAAATLSIEGLPIGGSIPLVAQDADTPKETTPSETVVAAEEIEPLSIDPLIVKGDIRQSVSRWCFGNIPMDVFCKTCKKIGLVGIDLVGENEWDIVNQNDMIVTMGNGIGPIERGFNRLQNHDWLVEGYERLIPIAAEKKVPNLICFSGNRGGISDEEGLGNCLVGLQRIMSTAEKHNITIIMELLNSKQHKDYQCDHTAWGAELAKKIGSDRFKLLYDIYHMQKMEGEIIETIRNNKDVIGHYHTAGVPGRNDLDDQQEIYYPAVMHVIKETGFKGFIAHELLPKKGIQSLRDAVKICDV